MAKHDRKPVDVGLPRLQEVKVKKRKERQKFPIEKLDMNSRYKLQIRQVGSDRVICNCVINGDLAERIIDEAKKNVAAPAQNAALKQLDKVKDEFEELRKMIRQ